MVLRFFALTIALVLASCASPPPPAPGVSLALIETVAQLGHYETFLEVLKASGFDARLAERGSFTVFAPTDEAFAKLPEGALKKGLHPENREALRRLVELHILPGRLTTESIGHLSSAKTLAGASVSFIANQERIIVGQALIVDPDHEARNGIVHGIDAVLRPPAGSLAAPPATEKEGGPDRWWW